MRRFSDRKTIVLFWLIWAVIMTGYQAYVRARFEPQRPDYALSWTSKWTLATSQNDKPYLKDSFLNEHVSWDSEYYLSIALAGYDDPKMRAIPHTFNYADPQIKPKGERPDWISLNHAFLPFYPLSIRLMTLPLAIFRLNPIATATLAGVLVSLFGALCAMIALYDLGYSSGDEGVGRRAAYYLLFFPAGMFLAEVYTEGLFLGLSFGALALARRKIWICAALLASCATLTRTAGVLLLLPLLWYWWNDVNSKILSRKFSWRDFTILFLVVSPLLAYFLWDAVLGESFRIVQSQYYNRGLLVILRSGKNWLTALQSMFEGNPQAQAYYLVEFAAIGFSILSSILFWKRDRQLALYSFAVIIFSLTSGMAQGMHRYAMAAPTLFLLPAILGGNEIFDRAWTLANILLLGIFAAMFSFDFWAG